MATETEQSIEDVRAENRALRASIRALTQANGLAVMRMEATIHERSRLSIVLSIPHVSQEREERMCRLIGESFGAAFETAVEGMRGFRSEESEAACG